MVAVLGATYRIIFSPAVDAVTLPVTTICAGPDEVVNRTSSVLANCMPTLKMFSPAAVWLTLPFMLSVAVPVVEENISNPLVVPVSVVE